MEKAYGCTKITIQKINRITKCQFFHVFKHENKNFKLDCPSDGNFKDICALLHQIIKENKTFLVILIFFNYVCKYFLGTEKSLKNRNHFIFFLI